MDISKQEHYNYLTKDPLN